MWLVLQERINVTKCANIDCTGLSEQGWVGQLRWLPYFMFWLTTVLEPSNYGDDNVSTATCGDIIVYCMHMDFLNMLGKKRVGPCSFIGGGFPICVLTHSKVSDFMELTSYQSVV